VQTRSEKDYWYKYHPVDWVRDCLGVDPEAFQAELLTATEQYIATLAPRQRGKSTGFAWRALHRAHFWSRQTVLFCASARDQAIELLHRVMDAYGEMNPRPQELTEEAKLHIMFKNASRIISLPSSERVRSYSPDLVIVDEAAWAPDRLFTALLAMLGVTGGTFIAGSSAYFKRGFFYRQWTSKDALWRRIEVKPGQSRLFKAGYLKDQQRLLPGVQYKAEHENVFMDIMGEILTEEQRQAMFDDTIEAIVPIFGRTGARTVSEDVEPVALGRNGR